MSRTLSVWVGASIIYLYGTVNGEAATFTLVGAGEWQAIVPRAEDDNYILHLEAYSANGLEGVYNYTLYYGMRPLVTDRTGGYYNIEDLNRVGGVVRYLADTLDVYGYAVDVAPKADWTIADIPRAADMETYLGDVRRIKEKFYGATPLPPTMENLTAEGANNIERLLAEVDVYIGRMTAGFRKCGTFKSGQGVILP